MNLIIKRDPVWLDCLPTPDVSATLLLIGGDGLQVAVPVPLLLAVSPVVRSILTDHLPPAYSPCCLSLPATTGDILLVFREILAKGAAADAHEDEIEEVRQVFEILGVEALIVSCQLGSIQEGQALDREIKQESSTEVTRISLDEENTFQPEIFVKVEHKENICVEVESEIGEPCRQNITKKYSLNIQQSPSCLTSNSEFEEIGKTEDKEIVDAKAVSDKPNTFSQTLVFPQNMVKRSGLNFQKSPPVTSVHMNECNLCLKSFSKKAHLLRHVQSVHDKIKIPCNLCPLKFTKKYNLSRHVKSVHDEIEFEFPCNLCPLKYKQKDNMLRHVKSVHEKIRIPCNLCTQKFTLKSSLKIHMDSVHKKIVYPCNLCPQKFTLKSSLKAHVNSVHKRMKCP